MQGVPRGPAIAGVLSPGKLYSQNKHILPRRVSAACRAGQETSPGPGEGRESIREESSWGEGVVVVAEWQILENASKYTPSKSEGITPEGKKCFP